MKEKPIQEAYAAYHHGYKWIPLSSISGGPEEVETWINETYYSNKAREKFHVIKIAMSEAR